MFDSKEEASMRLDGTVIQGPNGPVYVKSMETASRLSYREFSRRGGLLPSAKVAELHEGFSTKPSPLGYMNRGESCYYLQRMPVRKYKQGLHDAALRVVSNGKRAGVGRNRLSFMYESVGFLQMWVGNYPSLLEVKAMLRTGDYVSQAFGREWALGYRDDKTYTLFYKGNDVGYCGVDGGEFVLDDRRKYLQEALMEVVI